jgi:hypothetical protein
MGTRNIIIMFPGSKVRRDSFTFCLCFFKERYSIYEHSIYKALSNLGIEACTELKPAPWLALIPLSLASMCRYVVITEKQTRVYLCRYERKSNVSSAGTVAGRAVTSKWRNWESRIIVCRYSKPHVARSVLKTLYHFCWSRNSCFCSPHRHASFL